MTGLHPFLASWAVLLALSSLARYEPATWSKMIDIDQSAEANPIEHLLEETTDSVTATVLYLLTTFRCRTPHHTVDPAARDIRLIAPSARFSTLASKGKHMRQICLLHSQEPREVSV